MDTRLVAKEKQLESWATIVRECRNSGMKTKDWLAENDIKREGIEIGEERGNTQKLISLVCSKLRKGKSVDVIADEVEKDYGVVDEICVIANTFAPDFQSDLVFEAYMERHE